MRDRRKHTISRQGAWRILLISAMFEAIWATALGQSDGLTNVIPTLTFGFALAVSMVGLSIAMHHIAIGTAYAVWVGIGAVLTVTFAMLTGEEPISVLKVLFLVGIVGCTVGLKFVGHPQEDTPAVTRQSPTEAKAPKD
ncbi:DMT family transporter [Jonesia quinghaiensis]|uniref:DMT family transporter n=1 Tax=Jonesia quinghaiensis TaxID=262806 RepID=UPI0003F80569|nr:multidrug efflux SMR transporter [Jonesia quinghaiensis]